VAARIDGDDEPRQDAAVAALSSHRRPRGEVQVGDDHAMNKIPKFTEAHAACLQAFLAAPERPQGTLSYWELAGLLFTVCCAPEMVVPSEWLPLVFAWEDANYRDLREANDILQAMLALQNCISRQLREQTPSLPLGCEMRQEAVANLHPEAPVSGWARGFATGHEWLTEQWAPTPEKLDDELGSILMVLSFFGNRDLAEAYRKEFFPHEERLEVLAAEIREIFPAAIQGYADLSRSISEALREQRGGTQSPATTARVGRNDPCPCGSGRKYKKCCGSRAQES
jgi:uncharacterized protein